MPYSVLKTAIRTMENITQLADRLIEKGLILGASDIHIEPLETLIRTRYRVDGLLSESLTINKSLQNQLVARLKIIGNLDVSESRLPQDGKTSITINDKKADLRISTIPTVLGEKVEIRVLDRTISIVQIKDLGFENAQLKEFERLIRPQGLVLITGPTGSGKTTTLYSAIEKLNTGQKNIITIEDPVEYQINGISQMQVNIKAGITFSKGLRAMLRQDPDIILVGEIRDSETAKIASQAAMTGHLVFSTLHTNSAASAIERMVDMGVEQYLLASSLIGVIAQRLLRVSFQGGYKGRRGVFEMISVTEEAQRAIIKDFSSMSMNKFLFGHSLKENCMRMVKEGVTDMEEVCRVL